MAEQKLEVINKAADLMEYSIRITSNKKRYPAKFRQLIARIQDYSMDIYGLLIDANRLKLEDSKSKRLELQTMAVNSCDKLSGLIEMSMNLGLVGSETVENWQKKISDVKYMTIGWRSRDRLRQN